MDTEMLIVIGIGILVLLYLVNRVMSANAAPTSDETHVPPRAQSRPRYDDPNVRGRGTFGGRNSTGRRRVFPFPSDPNQYPRPGGTVKDPAAERGKKRYDDDEIESRGTFGS